MNRVISCLAIAIFVVIFSSKPSFALVTRHDVPLEHYQQFALNSVFNPVGRIMGTKGFCTGTLIDERTVLTAAHCSNPVSFYLPNENQTALTRSYRVVGKRMPDPFYNGELPGLASINSDLMLVYLDYPVAGLSYPEIASDLTQNHLTGQDTLICGFGDLGPGHHRVGSPNTKGLKLAGMTRLVEPVVEGNWVGLRTQFIPDLPYSANSAKGDSGGPLFLLHPQTQRYAIIGVSSRLDMADYQNSDANWYRAACFLRSQGAIDDLTLSVCASVDTQVVLGLGFRGYFTSSHFSYVSQHASFINEGKAVVDAISPTGTEQFPHYWSDVGDWVLRSGRTNFQPGRIDNASSNDQFGTLLTNFHVKVDGTLIADGNYRVDALSLNNPLAKLVISPNTTISAIRTKLEAGSIVVNGSLETQRLVIDQSELSGNGSITIAPTPYPERVTHEAGVVGVVVNESGHINLGDDINVLTIAGGGYRQGSAAKLSVLLRNEGASSMFIVDKAAVLNGTLSIKIDVPKKAKNKAERLFAPKDPTYHLRLGFGGWADSRGAVVGFGALNNMFSGGPMISFEQPNIQRERRWTILKTNEKIWGDFNNVEFIDAENVAGKLRLEYFPDRIDVVMSM